MLLSFEPLDDAHGVDVVDHIERRRCTLRTPTPVEPREAAVDEFRFPIDRGTAFTTGEITLPHTITVCVRNSDGLMVDELANGDSRSFPTDRYSIELCAPIKLYAVVDGSFSTTVSADRADLDFGEPTEVLVGARSHHKQPAATITTTADPADMMAAISHLGSALKTTTCERSYPTLRGHPPEIELGDELRVPGVVDVPDTGITVELPREYRSVFVAAPLAYYLGAEVVPGDEPRIVADTGFTHPLSDPARGFEGEVERVLKQAFFLDCVTRTEGYYQFNLHERNAIEDEVDLDFARLYEEPLAAQLEAYLSVPFPIVEPHLPKWKLTAHVALDPSHVTILPFLVNDLAAIRSPEIESVSAVDGATGPTKSVRGDEFTRRTARAQTDSASTPSLIRLEETDAMEQAWVGDGAPLGASKAMIEAFRNRLDRTPSDGDIDITVVCNDRAMDTERDLVDEVYGSRDELPFDVRVRRSLTTDELEDVLCRETDFFHYIGHIDERGFECVDGAFDAATLDHTGVDAFFLNACTSYGQGLHLIRAGGIAGVVTLQDVINSGAERIGRTLARLLNRGFPLRAALNIAKERSIMGGHYLVVGDGNFDIVQTESGIPAMCEITNNNGEYNLEYITYLTIDRGIGCVTIPWIGENDEYFITSGLTGKFKLSKQELSEFINSSECMPVYLNDSLRWSDDIF